MATARFGPLLKELRVKQELTLRQFCKQHGFDPGNYSRVERGLFAPPSNDKIKEYAQALGIEVGADEYVDLLDYAAVDRGELPRDILSDEQLVAELPVLFRTLRGDPVEPERLDRLIEILRKR